MDESFLAQLAPGVYLICKSSPTVSCAYTDSTSAFYGVSLNNPIILSTIGFSGGPTVYKILMNTAVGNLIIVLAGGKSVFSEQNRRFLLISRLSNVPRVLEQRPLLSAVEFMK